MQMYLLRNVYACNCENARGRAVVVTQWVERSLPKPEVRGSNPVIGKLLYRSLNC